ncbi:MAG: 2Fe-2S iron-sulfur cluster-binding protein [Pseudomonadota bacterium]
MTTASLISIIFLVILVQFIIFISIRIYRYKYEYLEKSTKKVNLQLVSPLPELTPKDQTPCSTPAWEGFREFTVIRRKFEDIKHSICSFYLVPADGKQLPVFKPGQYLTFKLLIDDKISHKSKTIMRCYSLSDSYHADHYRVSIKRVLAPAGKSDTAPGLSSNFFHDHVQEGCKLLLKPPSGHFHLQENKLLPIVVIGGGIGITPMLSILNTVLKTGIKREVWLYYGIRNGDEHMMKELLQAYAREYDNFHLHVCYSAPNEKDIKGIDYQHNGRVTLPLLRNTLKLIHYQFYVCGPKPLMESLIPELHEWGVDSGDIYYESFGPASLAKPKKVVPSETMTQPISVTFGQSDKCISWDPSADSLLDFAEASGIEVESGCRAGSCGSCQTAIKTGEVEYKQQADVDITTGNCLLCISTPKNNLTLDL